MTTHHPPARRRFGPAADVAEQLRSRILAGRFADGDVLPKIDDLSDEFGASRPAVREAFLMLEAEGLVTVKRGNVGGAHFAAVGGAVHAVDRGAGGRRRERARGGGGAADGVCIGRGAEAEGGGEVAQLARWRFCVFAGGSAARVDGGGGEPCGVV